MALTMINPTSSWFETVELPVITRLYRQTVNGKELLTADEIFDKTSNCLAKLVNKTRLCWFPEFKLRFKYLCKSYGIKRKPTTVKNLQAIAILERVHQVLEQMLRTAEVDMAKSVTPNDVDVFLDNTAWTICSTYHTVLNSLTGNGCHHSQLSIIAT